MDDAIFNLRWIQGQCTQKARFLSEKEAAFITGNCIKFCKLDSYSETSIEGPLEGIQCFTADSSTHYFAVSNNARKTVIYIIDYLTLKIESRLKNEDFCEYQSMEFADTPYLLTLTKGPDFTITLWSFSKEIGQKLKSVSHSMPTLDMSGCALSVHPYLKQYACFQQFDSIHYYEIYSVGKEMNLRKDTLFLPYLDDKDCFTLLEGKKVQTLTWFDKMLHEPWGIHSELINSLPLAACCKDMSESELVMFYDFLDKAERIKISCHCWITDVDIILACITGSVVQTNIRAVKLKYLHSSGFYKNEINSNTINCMAMNKNGLFIGKQNGDFTFVPDINKWSETRLFSIHLSPMYMDISPDYTGLLIVVEKGAVLSYDTIESKVSCLSVETDNQAIIGIYIPNDLYVITAKVNGRIEAWEISSGHKLSEIEIDETVTHMAGSLLIPILLIASDTSYLYVLDVSLVEEMRIIRILRPSEEPIIQICTENYCKFALLLTKYNKIFVFSILPSNEFSILGYINCVYEVKDMMIFSKGFDEISYIILLCWSNANKDSNCILTFDLTADFENNYENYWIDKSGIFDEESIKFKKYALNFISSGITLHYQFGLFFSILQDNEVRNSNHILRNLFPENDEKRMILKDFDMNCSRLIMSPSHNILLIINDVGKVCLWCLNYPYFNLLIDISYFIVNNQIPRINVSLNEKTLIIANHNGDIACYDIPSLKEENKKDWIVQYYEEVRNEETRFLTVIETKSKSDCQSIPWATLMIDKLNEESFRNLETKKTFIFKRMISIRDDLENLLNESSSIPEEHQWGIEEFVLEDKLRDNLLKERENDIENHERSLITELNNGLKSINDIRRECLDSMLEVGHFLDSFGSGRRLYNYATPYFSESTKFLIKRAWKSFQIDRCLKSLMDGKECNDGGKELNFNYEEYYDEDKEKIGTDLREDIMFMQSKEDRINYALLLEYIIFHKRLAFNKRFQNLLQLKKDTVITIKSNNAQIKHILSLIDEEQELWDPDDVVETLESKLEATEEEIEQNCHLKSEEESKMVKGIAAHFLQDEWLQKILEPDFTKVHPRLKRDAIGRLRKEVDKLGKISSDALNYYEKCHEKLVDCKLEWDLSINQDELQLFLILFCTSNRKLIKEGNIFIKQHIGGLRKQVSDLTLEIKELDTSIKEGLNIERNNLMREVAKIDGEVQQLSRISRNKQEFLDSYDERPSFIPMQDTLNPYRQKNIIKFENFNDLNSSKLKPSRVPMNVWKEMCMLREEKARVEEKVKVLDLENTKINKKMNEISTWLRDSKAHILIKSVFLKYMLEKRMECNIEMPLVTCVSSAQLETAFPKKIIFNFSIFIRKYHIEALNSVLSIAGEHKLQLLQKKETAEKQIQKNVLRLQNINLEIRDLKKEIHTVMNTPPGREVLYVQQDPTGFGPHIKIQELEKSNEQEKRDLERQMVNVSENLNRMKMKMQNLQRGMKRRMEEINILKGKIVELRQLGNKI